MHATTRGTESNNTGAPARQFVWGWGRLTAAPLLLSHATTPSSASTSAHPPLPLPKSRTSVALGDEAMRDSVAAHAPVASAPCPHSVLAPTLVEAMETRAVRVLLTAAHITIAVTHGGTMYSWRHGGLTEPGPAVAVDAAELASLASLTRASSTGSATAATAVEARSRAGSNAAPLHSAPLRHNLSHPTLHSLSSTVRSRSGPSSRAESPVTMFGAASSVGSSPYTSSSTGLGAPATTHRGLSLPRAALPVAEKKFRRVVGLEAASATGTAAADSANSTGQHVAIGSAALGRNCMLAVDTSGAVFQWDWAAGKASDVADQARLTSALAAAAATSPSSPATQSADASGELCSVGVPPTLLPLPRSSSSSQPILASGVALGAHFALLSSSDGELYTWGRVGTHGRLGLGPHDNTVDKPVGGLSAALAAAGAVNAQSSSTADSTTTPPRPSSSSPDSSPLLPGSPDRDSLSVPLPTLVTSLRSGRAHVSKVAAGWSHAIVLTSSGEAFVCGCGLGGRLGTGNQLDLWTPTPLTSLSSAVQVVEVSAGYHHSFALDVFGKVWSWGGNEAGQLGHGDRISRGRPEELSTSLLPDQVVSLCAGAFHTALVTAVGELYTCGLNEGGQLGLGHTLPATAPTRVAALSGMDVQRVACAGDYTVAVTDHFVRIQADYFSDASSQSTSAPSPVADDADATYAYDVPSAASPTSSRRGWGGAGAGIGSSPASFGSPSPLAAALSASPPIALAASPVHAMSAISAAISPAPTGTPLCSDRDGSFTPLTALSPLPVPPTPIIFEEGEGYGDGDGEIPDGSGAHASPESFVSPAFTEDPTSRYSASTMRSSISFSASATGSLGEYVSRSANNSPRTRQRHTARSRAETAGAEGSSAAHAAASASLDVSEPCRWFSTIFETFIVPDRTRCSQCSTTCHARCASLPAHSALSHFGVRLCFSHWLAYIWNRITGRYYVPSNPLLSSYSFPCLLRSYSSFFSSSLCGRVARAQQRAASAGSSRSRF